MATTTPLRDAEAEAGARFRSYGGLELPEKFADAMAECEAVRRAAGLFDLSFRGRLRLVGSDRASFLHNLLSNDVTSLRAGEGRHAALLTDQSKIVTDLDIVCAEEAIDLDLDARVTDAARAHLERYLVADDVEVEDRRGAETTIGVHGPAAAAVLGPLVEGALPAAPLAHRAARIGAADVRILARSWTGEPGFDVFVARADGAAFWGRIRAAGEPLGLVPAGMFAFNVLRVEAGIPWVGLDFDATTLALEAALEGAISFTKGCYLGQETVERVAARGHVNRLRVGLRLDSDRVPRSGARVSHAGKEVGRVTSAVFSPTLEAVIALATIRREAIAPETRVEIDVGGTATGATVTALPFVLR